MNALTRESGDEEQTRTSPDDTEQTPESGEPSGSTVTVRYELPYRSFPSERRHLGTEIARRILRELAIALNGTDYTFLLPLPAVDVHTHRAQREVLTIGIDADTVEETSQPDQTELTESPEKSRADGGSEETSDPESSTLREQLQIAIAALQQINAEL